MEGTIKKLMNMKNVLYMVKARMDEQSIDYMQLSIVCDLLQDVMEDAVLMQAEEYAEGETDTPDATDPTDVKQVVKDHLQQDIQSKRDLLKSL